jgi:hypothetical protein
MDCHNRPAHSFEAPDPLVNQAMSDGGINPAIPMIKGKAVEVLTKDYKSLEEATKEIRSSIEEYYAKKQEVYYGEHKESIDKAIKTILTIYQRNFYPEMKVRWEAYPDNNSHMISLGCFRCHDDEHKTKTGEVISRDCTICHIITEQGSGEAIEKSTEGLEFKHPFQEGDDSWKGTNCSDCHTGGS